MDLELRNATYRQVVVLGRVPSARELAAATGRSEDQVRAGWRELHAAHALVLDATGDEIRMANPFAAVPTAFRVHAGRRWWYATCAWDALGICAALHVDGRIETSCADCCEPLTFDVRDERPDDPDLLFQRWLGGRPPGATISVTSLSALAHAWWGDRLLPDWAPRTRAQNQAVLDRLALRGAFWQLG